MGSASASGGAPGTVTANDPLGLSSVGHSSALAIVELRREIYWQLGWLGAELSGSIDGTRPTIASSVMGQAAGTATKLQEDQPVAISARLLSARAMVLSGLQRQQNAVIGQGQAGGQAGPLQQPSICGLAGLRSPSADTYAELFLHDPRPGNMYDAAPKNTTTFMVRAGGLVLFPCWLRYDLTVSCSATATVVAC